MLSSVAERVYWLGRYLERLENTARLVNVYSSMLLDLPTGTSIGWGILVDITGCNDAYEKVHETLEEKQVVRFLLADTRNGSSVLSSVNLMRENARTAREVIPADAWELINNLYLHMKDNIGRSGSRRGRQQLLETVIGECQRIIGLLTGTMNHDSAYAFIQLGRKIERADMTSRMVDVGSISLLPAFNRHTSQRLFLEPYENIAWMNVLRCVGGYQAYRQKMRSHVQGEDVVRFLLQDDEFPRAIGYCLNDLEKQLQALPGGDNVLRAVGRVKKITTRVSVSELLDRGLLDFIDELQISIADIHDEINRCWFHPEELHKLKVG
ncbi:MAG TPA: alpha-E domain-containing protein [Hyphomicrobiales bacterium]|nr:alpha-E domain-containing protein [Hyphomicrobiales bacterium]